MSELIKLSLGLSCCLQDMSNLYPRCSVSDFYFHEDDIRVVMGLPSPPQNVPNTV